MNTTPPVKNASSKNADLQLAFDVGHSSIGWAVLRVDKSKIEIKGTGVVIFTPDDCLAFKRRNYRRQRRHARATRQRIRRIEILLEHLGFISRAELQKKHAQAGGHAAPWLLATRILASNGDKKYLLDWPQLWDVLRWYAHNRGYDGNRLWSDAGGQSGELLGDEMLSVMERDPALSTDDKADIAKVKTARKLMTEMNTESMSETVCRVCGIEDPFGPKISSNSHPLKRFKAREAAFDRNVVVNEVRRLLRYHAKELSMRNLWHDDLERVLCGSEPKQQREDWKAISCPGIKAPKRYFGGLLFGQLMPRFENRIISTCPITYARIFGEEFSGTGDAKKSHHKATKFSKVPAKHSREFLEFRWAMLLANIQVIRPGKMELSAAERVQIDAKMRELGFMDYTEPAVTKKGMLKPGVNELRDAVRAATGCVHDNIEAMLLPPDAKKALRLFPIKTGGSIFRIAWRALDDTLRRRFAHQLMRGNGDDRHTLSLAEIKRQLEKLGRKDLIIRLEHEVSAECKGKADRIEAMWGKTFYFEKLKGRAPFTREVMKQAIHQVMEGCDPRKENGVLFVTAEMRGQALQRKIEEQTNNHLVRHRLLILRRLLKQIIENFASGETKRVSKVTIEVNRDLREMSGMTVKQKKQDMGFRTEHHRAISERLEREFTGKTFNGQPIRVSAGLIRKARIADDLATPHAGSNALSWECPYTGRRFDPFDLVTKQVDKDHVVPRSQRRSDALEALVITFSAVNRMKKNMTAMQFIKAYGGKQVEGMKEYTIIRTPSQYLQFVDSLSERGSHLEDVRRKKKRKELMKLDEYDEPEFTPRDLTMTSQLVRLGAQIIKKYFACLPQPLQPISLPGSVTGTLRNSEGWNLLGCLEKANPNIIQADGTVKKKHEIREVTHLHHALDACALGLISHFVPNNGEIWRLIVKGRLNPQEQEILRDSLDPALRLKFSQKGYLEFGEIDARIKQQIRERLAEKRVAQHIAYDRSGLPVEENTRGVLRIENGRAYLQQRARQKDGSIKIKLTDERLEKVVGVAPTGGGGKLVPMRGVRVIEDNFAVAILDHAENPVDTLQVIPWHKVWHRIEAARAKNGGHAPRLLRAGMVFSLERGSYAKLSKIWMVRKITNHTRDGVLLCISFTDIVDYAQTKVHFAKDMVRLKTLLADGLKIIPPRYTGYPQNSENSTIGS